MWQAHWVWDIPMDTGRSPFKWFRLGDIVKPAETFFSYGYFYPVEKQVLGRCSRYMGIRRCSIKVLLC